MSGLRREFQQWWPLATSWFFLTFEPLILAALVARMPDSSVQLATWGGFVYPITVLLEAPTFMLLSASATLVCDRESYRSGLRHALTVGAFCTALQVVVIHPTVYRWLMESLLSPPPGVAESAYTGFVVLALSALFVALRRFHQGILVRLGRSRTVGIGTALRIGSGIGICLLLMESGRFGGATTAAMSCGASMVLEAIYAYVMARPALAELPESDEAPVGKKLLLWPEFLKFYAPLASTSVLLCLAQPIGSATMARAALPLQSLAIWPAVITLINSLRSLNTAIPELYVSRCSQRASVVSLKRLTVYLCALQTAVVVVLGFSSLGSWWFLNVAGLSSELTELAILTLRLAVVLPLFATLQAWQQGRLLAARASTSISAGVLRYLLTVLSCAWLGIALTSYVGALVFIVSVTIATVFQWIYLRAAADSIAAALHTKGEA